jgi:hypothetical protein
MPKRKSQAQLRKEVVAHVEDLPRQLLALETAMEKFGENFELSEFKPAFEGHAGTAGAIDSSLCKRLKRLQKVRAEVEHEYLQVKAGPLHQAVVLLAASARDFVGPYTAWIKPYL